MIPNGGEFFIRFLSKVFNFLLSAAIYVLLKTKILNDHPFTHERKKPDSNERDFQ